MDFMERVFAYESGELTDDEMVALFQELIDTGNAWSLQDQYGRQAVALIQAGYCIGECPHLEFSGQDDGTAKCDTCGVTPPWSR
jgi:hypothetical protein